MNHFLPITGRTDTFPRAPDGLYEAFADLWDLSDRCEISLLRGSAFLLVHVGRSDRGAAAARFDLIEFFFSRGAVPSAIEIFEGDRPLP